MYYRLALGNVRKSIRDYGIYFLTLVFGVCVFYAFNSITQQSAVLDMTEAQNRMLDLLSTIIGGVSVFIAVVLGFLIVYASRYLIKRRKKEFGTYLLLGMSPSKVSRVIIYETLFVGIISLVIGLVVGLLLSQILLYITAALFSVKMDMFVFVFSTEALANTILCFAVIFIIALVFNVISISRYKLIDLINADRKTEVVKLRSIPLSILLFLVSLVLIGVAYALLLDNGLQEFDEQFALSTALVCIGTLLFFFSISGFLLRAIQTRKNLYLKGLNMFTLRQLNAKINTAFLSISLVCMALFLAITSTCGGFSLCTTFTENLETTTKYDASFTSLYRVESDNDEAWVANARADNYDMELALSRDVEGWGEMVECAAQINYYQSETSIQQVIDATPVELSPSLQADNLDEVNLELVTLSDYNALREFAGLAPLELEANEYMLWCDFDELMRLYSSYLEQGETIELSGRELHPASSELETLLSRTSSLSMNTGTVIVPDELVADDQNYTYTVLNVMYAGERDEIEEPFVKALSATYDEKWEENTELIGWPYFEYITAVEVFNQNVGLSVIIAYLAIYIGFVLLIACAAILALQQLSEAADNVKRYGILEKIGAEARMVNKALITQIGVYFIFPLILALCHSFVALTVVTDVVSIYGHLNIAGPLGVTVALFLIVYGGYFVLTYFASRTMIHVGNRAKG